MARLNVLVAVRWAGDTPDEVSPDAFRNTPMVLAVAVTDGDGARVDLSVDNLRVGYQHTVEASEDSIAVISDFHSNGPTFGDTRWHSCTVSPQPTDSFGHDEVFLYVTVRRGQDVGQALVLARYRQRIADVRAGVRDLQNDAIRIDARVGEVESAIQARVGEVEAAVQARVREVEAAVQGLSSMVARLPSGITAVNALGQILAMLEEIKD